MTNRSPDVPITQQLTARESAWLDRQARKRAGSKFVRHQGKRECDRRVRQMARRGEFSFAIKTSFGITDKCAELLARRSAVITNVR